MGWIVGRTPNSTISLNPRTGCQRSGFSAICRYSSAVPNGMNGKPAPVTSDSNVARRGSRRGAPGGGPGPARRTGGRRRDCRLRRVGRSRASRDSRVRRGRNDRRAGQIVEAGLRIEQIGRTDAAIAAIPAVLLSFAIAGAPAARRANARHSDRPPTPSSRPTTLVPRRASCSTFDRLFATQADLYKRVTGRDVSTDEDKALASWYWRNLHYAHGEEGKNDCFAAGFDKAEWNRDYWTGLFAHGFGLCGTTHSQWTAEMDALLGHCRGRVVGVSGHNSFEVYLTGGPYGQGRWVLLDHDISTVDLFPGRQPLLSIPEIGQDLKRLTDPKFIPDRQHGWRVSGLARRATRGGLRLLPLGRIPLRLRRPAADGPPAPRRVPPPVPPARPRRRQDLRLLGHELQLRRHPRPGRAAPGSISRRRCSAQARHRLPRRPGPLRERGLHLHAGFRDGRRTRKASSTKPPTT